MGEPPMKYEEAHLDFLRKHASKMQRSELCALFNKTFNATKTESAIKGLCKRLGLPAFSDGRFNKGHIPANKGTKGVCKANKTSFKKGNTPHNTKKVGSIVLHKEKDGYTYMRIKIAEPNSWQMLHAYVWEHKHGKIPEGFCVIFKDRNTFNTSLDNLMLVSRSELSRLNKQYPAIDTSLREVALQVVKLQHEVIKKGKR